VTESNEFLLVIDNFDIDDSGIFSRAAHVDTTVRDNAITPALF
jgi:hypothetical protein